MGEARAQAQPPASVQSAPRRPLARWIAASERINYFLIYGSFNRIVNWNSQNKVIQIVISPSRNMSKLGSDVTRGFNVLYLHKFLFNLQKKNINAQYFLTI